MTLTEITEKLRYGVETSGFSESLAFDCGDDGVITIKDGAVTNEPAETACTIRISSKNLDKLIHGKLNPMLGVTMGKIRVSGDTSVAMKIAQLL